MSVKFCKICLSLLGEKIKGGNELLLTCGNCKEEFTPDPTDTLTSQVTYKSKQTTNENVIKFAGDNTSPDRWPGTCPKCKIPFLTKIYSDDLVPKYVCVFPCDFSTDHSGYLRLTNQSTDTPTQVKQKK